MIFLLWLLCLTRCQFERDRAIMWPVRRRIDANVFIRQLIYDPPDEGEIEIYSFDRHFDHVAGIRRIEPF